MARVLSPSKVRVIPTGLPFSNFQAQPCDSCHPLTLLAVGAAVPFQPPIMCSNGKNGAGTSSTGPATARPADRRDTRTNPAITPRIANPPRRPPTGSTLAIRPEGGPIQPTIAAGPAGGNGAVSPRRRDGPFARGPQGRSVC